MFSLQSFAKLNLGLDVIKKRNDGFHDISSIMCKINLCDQIYFQESNKNEVFQEGITMEKNIVSKVLDYMTKEYSPSKKLKINIEKKIPYSSGMGGGSSNAATAIQGINKLLKLNLDSKEKFDIGLKFGSDIPFFLSNSSALISGRGDKIQFIKNPNILDFIIIYPFYQIEDKTKKVFEKINKLSSTENQLDLLKKINSGVQLEGPFYNSLEEPAMKVFYNLESIKHKIEGVTNKKLSMSGAGPTLYFVENSQNNILEIINEIKKLNLNIQLFNVKII